MPTARDPAGRLSLGGAALEDLVARQGAGTPSYVYDLSAVAAGARALEAAFEGARHLVAYAVKANSAGPIVRALAGEGCGADVVSGAELALALACGVLPDDVVYSGVAKTGGELDRAILAGPRGIGAVQVESVEEIARVAARAKEAGRAARVSIRVNPEAPLSALDTHAHVATGHDEAKFGVALEDVPAALARVRASGSLRLVGLTVHVGSQLTKVTGYVDSARVLFGLAARLSREEAPDLAFVDPGGGFGVDYGEGPCASPADFVRSALAAQRAAGLSHLALHVEPGRSLVAAHGVLVARVIQSKVSRYGGGRTRRWLMIDAGMNDLVRPALYQARHRIVELAAPPGSARAEYRVVGPVCESADDFGVHSLPDPPPAYVAILDAGAYGYTMASQYNGRGLPAEIFLDGGKVVARRERGTLEGWVRERAFG